MGVLANLKRIYYTDYEQQYQKLVEQLSYTINTTFESIIQTLNKNVSLRDNLLASVRDITFAVDATGTPTSPAAFSIDNSNSLDGTMVIRATSSAKTVVYPTGGIFISYLQNGTKVTITNITGLPANVQFTIRIVAFLT
jgi:hypothetical protein